MDIHNNNAGNVGIGTTSPARPLHVVAGGDGEGVEIQAHASNRSATLKFGKSDRSDFANISYSDTGMLDFHTTSGNEIGYRFMHGSVGIGVAADNVRLKVAIPTPPVDGTRIAHFGTDGSGSGFVWLALGTDGDRPGLVLDVPSVGPWYFWVDAAGKLRSKQVRVPGDLPASEGNGDYVGEQMSNRASKQDIRPFDNYSHAHRLVMNAPLHRFRYKREVEGYGEGSRLAKERIGFIADEVDPVFMWGDSIDQVSINGVLMASAKELQRQIDEAAAENRRIRADNDELVRRLARLEHQMASLEACAHPNRGEAQASGR